MPGHPCRRSFLQIALCCGQRVACVLPLPPEPCFLPSGRVQLGFSSRTAGCLVAGFQGRQPAQAPYVTGGIFSSLFLCILEQPLSSSERDFDILI